MSLVDRIENDLLTAVKEQDSLARDTLRGLKSTIKNYQIEKGSTDTSDSEVEQLIAKEVKRRRESIVAYEGLGKTELADSEKEELKLLEKYLPEQLGEEEIEAIVKEVISELGEEATTAKAMAALSARLRGRADMGLVSKVVNQALSN